MTNVLMVGFGEAFLHAVTDMIPPRSIIVLEEPDVIRKRELSGKLADLPCVAELVPAVHQQTTEFLDMAADIAGRWPVQAVLPALEYSVPAAAALAAKLGLPGAGETAAAVLRDKLRLREAAARGGIRNPAWREVHGPQDIVDFAGDRRVVVKPANRQASVGVHLLDRAGPAEAEAAWLSMTADAEPLVLPDRPLSWRYLVEERLIGPEYSVEALVRDGRIVFENVTAKSVIAGVHPVEIGHVAPAPLPASTRAAFGEAMRALVAATEFGTGILHAEWILTDDGPALIECAGRSPGDRIVDLIDLSYGTRLRLALIELLAGSPPPLPAGPSGGAAIRFLSAAPGVVERIDGEEQARELPGVRELRVGVAAGAVARVWRSSLDRHGYVIATGDDGAQADSRAQAAAGTIRIVTR
ncbi:ATP-grasp domain-containing protein [Actinoplanes sp. NPDC049118]|uniref:ATP-grasp domain-containing protein n=1 Tax=Actinoplanes sp. NPDC049118 TaxID=3155769 RepID=UPI0033E4D7BA